MSIFRFCLTEIEHIAATRRLRSWALNTRVMRFPAAPEPGGL